MIDRRQRWPEHFPQLLTRSVDNGAALTRGFRAIGDGWCGLVEASGEWFADALASCAVSRISGVQVDEKCWLFRFHFEDGWHLTRCSAQAECDPVTRCPGIASPFIQRIVGDGKRRVGRQGDGSDRDALVGTHVGED